VNRFNAGSVPTANWLISNVGTVCVPQGPCLVPVWPGITAPSGVLVAGLSFVVRDIVQELLGLRWALVALLIGGLISALIASPVLAAASVTAYLLAESIDMAVYTILRPKGFVYASVVSSVAGLVLDSTVFVWMAFGTSDCIPGQILGKAWMVMLAVPVLRLIRRNLQSGAAASIT